MRHLATTVVMALLLTLLLATGAAAHHPTGITITPSCSTGKVGIDVGYSDFGGGHFLRVTIDINGQHYVEDFTPLDAEGTFSIEKPLAGSSGTITVSAQAKTPGGDDEGSPASESKAYDCPVVTPTLHATVNTACVDRTGDGIAESARVRFTWNTDGSTVLLALKARIGTHLTQPATVSVTGSGHRSFSRAIGDTPTRIRATIRLGSLVRSIDRMVTCRAPASPRLPSLRFLGPCGDPMHAVAFRNPTGHALRAVFHWKHAITRTWRDTALVVPAHSTRQTGWKHVLGNSHMTARIGSVVRHAESAAPGNYRACPTS